MAEILGESLSWKDEGQRSDRFAKSASLGMELGNTS